MAMSKNLELTFFSFFSCVSQRRNCRKIPKIRQFASGLSKTMVQSFKANMFLLSLDLAPTYRLVVIRNLDRFVPSSNAHKLATFTNILLQDFLPAAFLSLPAGERGEGRTHLFCCLSLWTIDLASLWRRSTVPTPDKHKHHLGGPFYVFSVVIDIRVFAKVRF